jgi:outer membrane protein
VARVAAFASACLLGLAGLPASANSGDPLAGWLTSEGGAGIGAALRSENSPYRGGGVRNDFLPLYLYEGKYFYLHGYRAGIKFDQGQAWRFEAFLAHRFEGFPSDSAPSSLAGMAERGPGGDFGLSVEHRAEWGTVFAEVTRDISGASEGNEIKMGYAREWRSGGLRLRPYITISARDAKLNNYYYGVRDAEATPDRPAYSPGSGVNAQGGLYASYDLSARWRLLAGVYATHWSSGVRHSPIVDDRLQLGGSLGLMYDFTPDHEAWPDRRPFVAKVFTGKSTDCNLAPTIALACRSTNTEDGTSLTGIEVGRPFVERLEGWPVDFVGYLALIRHHERGLQEDFWEGSAYMKAYYYGFPWSQHVKTRIGFGAGLSYARTVPFVEARDQARRGRSTSRLLNYLSPTVDVSIGDIVNAKALQNTYFGFGVSHRSGIFGTSGLLGNVDGGSNYIYTYIETQI